MSLFFCFRIWKGNRARSKGYRQFGSDSHIFHWHWIRNYIVGKGMLSVDTTSFSSVFVCFYVYARTWKFSMTNFSVNLLRRRRKLAATIDEIYCTTYFNNRRTTMTLIIMTMHISIDCQLLLTVNTHTEQVG